MNLLGVTDIPRTSEQGDLLGIDKYVIGLENFIRRCPTPMSIAIQGDWGTGKTSTINLLMDRLNSPNPEVPGGIRCEYFNTWQYSQFDMSDSLYSSFVNCLVNKCSKNLSANEEVSKSISKIAKLVTTVGKQAVFSTIEDYTGLDVESAVNTVWKKQSEKMESIESLKANFEKLVSTGLKSTGKERMVIFIDDLDRLNPKIAVELLEVIKLFMDVKNCIFVLAIDYDVVVNGVREKYGSTISEEKCRSFFDKIIQLPFRMPVESYSLSKLLDDALPNVFKPEYADVVDDIVRSTLGNNPRTFKRLCNNFSLISSINSAIHTNWDTPEDEQLSNSLILCGISIQMSCPRLYTMLVIADNDELGRLLSTNTDDNETFLEALSTYNSELSLPKEQVTPVRQSLKALQEAVLSLSQLSQAKGKDTTAHVISLLGNSLTLTSVTSLPGVDQKPVSRKPSLAVEAVIVNDISIPVSDHKTAVVSTFKALIGEDMQLARDFMASYPKLMNTTGKGSSIFRQVAPIIEQDGECIYLGTSTGLEAKQTQVRTLCSFLRSRDLRADVQWLSSGKAFFKV